MNRQSFDHVVRAAGAILGTDEILVIGSQAMLAGLGAGVGLPDEVARSVEVDVAVPDDADGHLADLIDGSIGEASMFHDSFGYYAQGVSVRTAVPPPGWEERLVRYESPATSGVVARCLEPHDLWVAKAVAGRPKDREFCRALLDRGLVDRSVLADRLAAIEGLDAAVVERVRAWIER